MSEKALTVIEAAERLGIGRTMFFSMKGKLEANGLQVIKLTPKKIVIRERSLNALIAKAFENEMPFDEVTITPNEVRQWQ